MSEKLSVTLHRLQVVVWDTLQRGFAVVCVLQMRLATPSAKKSREA